MRDGYMSRVIILEPSTPNLTAKPGSGLPVLLMFHGGGHCVGHPEWEVSLLRLLVARYDMICIAPCYRLAPENPFPASINDAWDTLQWVVSESKSSLRPLLYITQTQTLASLSAAPPPVRTSPATTCSSRLSVDSSYRW